MTKISNISQLKPGDELTLTVKVTVRHVYAEDYRALVDHPENTEYISVEQEFLDSGLMFVEKAPTPFPTEPGIYVPADNSNDLIETYIYTLNREVWSRMSPFSLPVSGPEAFSEAQAAHEKWGGLVPLMVKER